MTGEFHIEINRVSKSYREGDREHCVFRDLNTRIAAGEFLVLLGRSGSGKSTLLNLISGIDSPDHGEIRVGDRNLTGLSEKERTIFRRRQIGFVFQAFNLIPTLTVAENLRLPLELNRVPARQSAQAITALLRAVGLEHKAEEFPDRLSGGEQQRIAVARALVHDPKIILADEPTGNLDLETGRAVVEMLERCVRKSGKTLIMATHSLEVTGRADRVMTIRGMGLSEKEIHASPSPT